MITALIFDFDGVIVDTEPLHYRAFQRMLEPDGAGFTWAAYVSDYIGYDDRDAFALAYRRQGRDLSATEAAARIAGKAEVFVQLVAESGVACYPGIHRLVEDCRSHGVPIGLCSGALRSDIDAVLERVGLAAAFDVLVTAEDVAAGKPDPEGYRRTLASLRLAFPDRPWSTGRAVAIEDTPAGIEAARGAGLSVVGVTTTQSADALHAAHRIVASVEAIRWEMLAAGVFDAGGG